MWVVSQCVVLRKQEWGGGSDNLVVKDPTKWMTTILRGFTLVTVQSRNIRPSVKLFNWFQVVHPRE